jgi:hypothetical protein
VGGGLALLPEYLSQAEIVKLMLAFEQGGPQQTQFAWELFS